MTTVGLDGWLGEATPEGSKGTSQGGAWEGGLPAAGTASAKALGWDVPDELQERWRGGQCGWIQGSGRQEREPAGPWGLARHAEHCAFCSKFSNARE